MAVKDFEYGFDHSSPAVMADPFPLYARMRKECPVNHTHAFGGFWVAASYQAVKAATMDFETFTNTQGTGIPPSPTSPMYPIDLDPPMQTAYRKVLNPYFTIEAVARWREPMLAETNRLIDAFIERGHVELAGELCTPMPVAIVLPYLGVPLEDRAEVTVWMDVLTRQRADLEAAAVAGKSMMDYLLQLAARRRADPGEHDDILAGLLACEIMGRKLTDEDIFRVLVIILFGGLDTTTGAMLEGVRYLAAHPDQLARLQADPSLWPAAVEEFVRYGSPAQCQRRVLTRDVEFEGAPLKAGDSLMLLYASANFDEAHFDHPEEVRIDRAPNDHLGFGHGPHICLGRNLARLEIEVMLKTIFERMPDLKIDPNARIEYHVSEARAIKALPASFTPGRPLG